ncbi:thioesterase family protein [Kaustia mangrovi]|uniref:Thioesterase family protein n=1 Tax=Kaustia mangrovi TaxID=2593653 RepID=A0A7S8C1X2_9HYPH|nr:thioesterase family protein [Kaustia mangrovi]QPC41875.1 thioesterase family protein [Kaustia mangrovi]
MTSDALFRSSVMTVEPQWIDYNGHLNMAYYNVLFDHGVDEAFAGLGLGPDYVKTHNASFYTMEVHLTYLRELMEGDPVSITLQMLDCDAKRCHFIQSMYHATEGYLAATSEQICMHVDMGLKKSAPFPAEIHDNIKAMQERHAALPRPPQVGHVIGIPRKA